jgi:hypothetical protein
VESRLLESKLKRWIRQVGSDLNSQTVVSGSNKNQLRLSLSQLNVTFFGFNNLIYYCQILLISSQLETTARATDSYLTEVR